MAAEMAATLWRRERLAQRILAAVVVVAAAAPLRISPAKPAARVWFI
jgi:hypothetical protein